MSQGQGDCREHILFSLQAQMEELIYAKLFQFNLSVR